MAEWKIASEGLVPLGNEGDSDYVGIVALAVVAGDLYALFVKEGKSVGNDGEVKPPKTGFVGGMKRLTDDSLPAVAKSEWGQESGMPVLPSALELDWGNAVFRQGRSQNGPGFHRKTFFVVLLEDPQHPRRELFVSDEIEDAFWVGIRTPIGAAFLKGLPVAHREALEFALGKLPVFERELKSSLTPDQEAAFLAGVRELSGPVWRPEPDPMPRDGNGETPYEKKQREQKERNRKKR